MKRLYHYFGAQKQKVGYSFRVYAPNAESVSVIGAFNNWNENANPMINKNGIFETIIKNAKEFDEYKYVIKTKTNKLFKADPFAFVNQYYGYHNSIIYNLDGYLWNDEKWMDSRNHLFNRPVNIYEVHLGSWKKGLSYLDLIDTLIPYVKKMGYTHIELLPICEHPFYGSWGYQVSGYYSISLRYGYPKDFMAFIDAAHQQGIGIIIDWVPGHFPKDDYGLIEFDGTYLYEDSEELKREHKRWGTRVFDYGKRWVREFLIENAHFFYDVYHIDGIRVDAVASMLYLDYDRKVWVKNKEGGNYHLEAISFIKELNASIYKENPYAMMIAEESTAFPKVTSLVKNGGLGFSYKWNMGWMNDTLKYMQTKENINLLTFSFMYAYNENYILPLSHDEVVHLKKSLINKMLGNTFEKFQSLRLYLGYMMTHPGKKLMFMGNEIAQLNEWNHDEELKWELLDNHYHKTFHKYCYELNHFYLKSSELWELDFSQEGFLFITSNEVLAYHRYNNNGEDLLIVLNFQYQNIFKFKLSVNKKYYLVFNSDDIEYGGNGLSCNVVNEKGLLYFNIPALTCLIFKGEVRN